MAGGLIFVRGGGRSPEGGDEGKKKSSPAPKAPVFGCATFKMRFSSYFGATGAENFGNMTSELLIRNLTFCRLEVKFPNSSGRGLGGVAVPGLVLVGAWARWWWGGVWAGCRVDGSFSKLCRRVLWWLLVGDVGSPVIWRGPPGVSVSCRFCTVPPFRRSPVPSGCLTGFVVSGVVSLCSCEAWYLADVPLVK